MSDPYVGEIRMFGGTFAPQGWMFCEGQLLAIAEFETLFNLIGTTYGGDGQSTFALPDLRGRVPVHMGQGPGLSSYLLAQAAGVETVTLNANQIPPHTHGAVTLCHCGKGSSTAPASHFSAKDTADPLYGQPDGSTTMAVGAATVAAAGGNQPHDNLQPFTCVSFIISMFGIFPSQT